MNRMHKLTATFLCALLLCLSVVSVNAVGVDHYGRKRGLPVPYGISLPERSRMPDSRPGDEEHPDWDGYYRIYYFEADDSWFENADKKEDGFEIGFYWYYGTERVGEWPGTPAKRISVPGRKNIFYAVAPSYANNIIWNNGIDEGLPTDEDYDITKKGTSHQTKDVNVEDEMFNQLGLDDLCGCLCILKEQKITTESPLTHEIMKMWDTDWCFFDPRTGDSGVTPFLNNGRPQYDENGFAMNPYYDMDYDYPCIYDFKLSNALTLQKYLASVINPGGQWDLLWDLDDNGKINLNDVLIIQKTLAKI